MIEKMNKYLIIGPKSIKDRFFVKAQEIGEMEFISIEGKRKHDLPKYVEKILTVLKILKKYPQQKQEFIHLDSASKIIDVVINLEREIEDSNEQLHQLSNQITEQKPFGQFSMEEVNRIGNKGQKYVQFFRLKHNKIGKGELIESLIHIERCKEFDYFMSISNSKHAHTDLHEVKITESTHILEERSQDLQREINEREKELHKCARYIDSLKSFFSHCLNQVTRTFAKEEMDYYLEDKVFIVEAWMPKRCKGSLDILRENFPVNIAEIKIEKGDKIPTSVRNKGAARIGEDLVDIYDPPSIMDRDPSPWVFWSFSLFFAMIIADAGYGLLFFSVAVFIITRHGHKLKGIKKRMSTLLLSLSLFSMMWGVLIGSYFGIVLSPMNILMKYSMIFRLTKNKVAYYTQQGGEMYHEWLHKFPSIENLTDPQQIMEAAVIPKQGITRYQIMESINDSLMMEFALVVGLIHLSFSFIRNLYRSWAGIGWVIAMWGGYLYFSNFISSVPLPLSQGLISESTMILVGKHLLIDGFVLAIILSLIQEKLAGIGAIFKSVEIFADVLSYIRLYALGLASMVLASTFNELGMLLGYFFGFFVILFGHIINLSLGILGGVIHGLRLNFLEWYHHSFEGGGTKFNPLKILTHD